MTGDPGASGSREQRPFWGKGGCGLCRHWGEAGPKVRGSAGVFMDQESRCTERREKRKEGVSGLSVSPQGQIPAFNASSVPQGQT